MTEIKKRMIFLVFALAAVFVVNISAGFVNGSLFGIFSSHLLPEIFMKIRLPRAITALAAGGTFALCGAVFQSLFRNPIASPFTLGTASGASLGVTIFITFFAASGFTGMAFSSLFAFGGAVLSMLIVYFASSRKRNFDPNTMILTGVIINFFFSGLILFIQYLTNQANAVRITRWTMGGIDIAGMAPAVFALGAFLIGSVLIYYFRDDLNLLYLGEEISVSRGVNSDSVRKYLFITASIMISSIVALTGPVAFIGIIAPHTASAYFGRNYRVLLPSSVMTGSIILLLCDIISRTVLWPVEIPVGIITALIGAPFFIRIIVRNYRSI